MNKEVLNIIDRLDLKKVKLFKGREGTGLNADVYFDKTKVLFAMDDGNGGEMAFHIFNMKKVDELEALIEALPEIELYPSLSGKPDMAWFIDQLLVKNENKKLEKDFRTKICVGVPNATSYLAYNMKKPLDLYPVAQLQKYIDESVKPRMKAGEVILNTNFEKLGLKK